MQNKRRIPYIYAATFLCLIALILIGISIFLIKRTSSTLIEIYWKQGELVVESIAISAQQTVESVELTPYQITKDLRKIAEQIEKFYEISNPIPNELLYVMLKDHKLESISIFNANDQVRTKITLNEDERHQIPDKLSGNQYSFTYLMHSRPGKIQLGYTDEKLQDIKFSIGLQIFIGSLEKRNIIKYVTFLNDRLKIIADSDPTRLGEIDEKQEYQDALESDASYFFLNNDTMEIIQPLSLHNDVKGVFKISFPTTEIDRIYRTTVKNTLIFSGWFMLIAIATTALILKFQQLYSKKMETMEKQIRENKMLSSMANLAAGVAHEVRNPLNSISMIIQRLQLEFTPKNDDDIEEYMSFTALMKNEVDRINQIVTEFLGLSRPFDLKKDPFDAQGFLEDMIKLFVSGASEKGVNLELRSTLSSLLYYGDHDKMTQVMVNLIKNALDATDKNGQIFVRSQLLKNQRWQIIVEDNGIGIPIDKLDHIFDIYFTTKQNGTGLGLYISRKIILGHQGTIEFSKSKLGGTKVVVELPLMKAKNR